MSWLYRKFGVFTPADFILAPETKSYVSEDLLPTYDYFAKLINDFNKPGNTTFGSTNEKNFDDTTKNNIIKYFLDQIDFTRDIKPQLNEFFPNFNDSKNDDIINDTNNNIAILNENKHDYRQYDKLLTVLINLEHSSAEENGHSSTSPILELSLGIITPENEGWISDWLLQKFKIAYNCAFEDRESIIQCILNQEIEVFKDYARNIGDMELIDNILRDILIAEFLTEEDREDREDEEDGDGK